MDILENRELNSMKKIKKDKKTNKGLIIFFLINGSFIFLIFSPYISNLYNAWLDDQFLEGIDKKINSVRKNDFKILIKYVNGTPLSNVEINYNLIKHDFYFGCNIFEFDILDNQEENDLYKNYFKNLFNFATLPFYWNRYEPKENDYPLDSWLENITIWCKENNITTKGHPLIWRNSNLIPDWVDPYDNDKISEVLKERIESVMTKYKGKIDVWDVVNEPTHLPSFGSLSVEQYVYKCYKWAHNADPNVLLTINDYGIIGHDFGYGPYYNLISRLLDKDVPIKCIGMQGREPRTDWIPAIEIWNTLEAYSIFDLPIHITEFTCPSSGFPITNSWKKGTWTEKNQAEYAERFYKVCFSHPSVEAIIWWDLYDGRSWVKNGGLIYENWEKKEVYNRLDNLINKEWHTEGSGTTDSKGYLKFNGFYGYYNISIPILGISRQIYAQKGGDTTFEIII